MQPVRTTIVDVSRTLATAVSAHSEAELPSPCTMYTLGPHPLRYAIPLATLRAQLVDHAESVSGMFISDKMPAFRPCPVLCLKNLFGESGEIALRCRVCFDVDTEGDGPPCAPSHLVDLFCSFLQTRLVGAPDLSTQPVWVWYGSFADKRASYHVYFPTMVWSRDTSNVYKDNDFTELQIQLDTFGLKLDTSITTSGIKVLGADKWIAQEKRWRGDVQRLAYVRFMEDVSLVTWEEAFAHCFAVAMPGDIGYDCEVKFRQIPRASVNGDAVAKRARNFTEVRVVAPDPVASSPDTRLIAAVPEWRDARFKYVHKDNGVVFVIPQSTHCPLKSDPSDNQPAFVHAMPGKTYVIRDVLGEQRVKCHVCSGKELLIPVPAVEASDELDAKILRQFAGWARFTPGRVLELPHGDERARVYTHNEFVSGFTRLNETVKLGKQSMPWPKYWLQLPQTPTYANGFIFDPSGGPNPGYFNQFSGFRRDVAHALTEHAAEFAKMTAQRLLEECPAWHDIVRRNVCRDDPALFNYFHSWMADCIQFPERRPGIALMILGPPGCGKGLSFKAMLHIYGRHAMQTNDLSTKWTALFEDKIFVFADEALAPKDKHAQQRLLSLITEEEIVTERKNHDPGMKRMYSRVGIASNRMKAVPMQAGERRYAVLGADFVAHPKDTPEAFALFAAAAAELENPRCLASLVEFWQRWPLDNVNLRQLPVTETTFRAHYAAFDDYERFVYHWLLSGNLCLRELQYSPNDPDHACVDALYQESARLHGHAEVRTFATTGFNVWRCEHCAVPKFAFATACQQMVDVAKAEVPLWKFLHELSKLATEPLFQLKRVRLPDIHHRPHVVLLSSQEQWRAAFLKHRGSALDSRIWDTWAIHI